MKKISYILALLLFINILGGCSKKNNDYPIVNPTSTVSLDNPINNFTWKAMNSWYNWKQNVPNLADAKDDNIDDYYSYLNSYSTPEDLFNSLLYDAGHTDRFSWFIEDYVEQQKQFQGISLSFGFKLQGVKINANGDVILYVRYVSDNSPAFDAGIKRGDIINAIDGIVLNENNYSDVVSKLSDNTVTLSFVTENNGTLTSTGDKTITSVEVSDNPVYLTKIFDNVNGRKVGYLVYNGFRSSYNDELNAAFADFKAAGINELILDLRLNGGGSVATSSYLASMIDGNAGNGKFADLIFNSKHTNENSTYTFQNTLNVYDVNGEKTGEETINRLSGIDRLYVLTSGSTASASEMIINGLKPYMPVKVIGTTTYGKNVGSITLYDSPNSDYTNQLTANSSHKNAMQPIVFQIFNKLEQSDYTQGFTPDIEVVEYEYWNNILPFGDENEVVLKAALDDIRGISAKSSSVKDKNISPLKVLPLENKFDKEMYITNDFLN
jgi:C-terminal processing protease CtpA/Prc